MDLKTLGANVQEYRGLNIIVSPSLQKAVHRKRTLKERLFSFPWRPFKKTVFDHWEGSGKMVKIGRTVFVDQPTFDKLKLILDKQAEQCPLN